MSRPRKTWDARLLDNVARTTVRHRHRRAVGWLTGLTVMLAVSGLVADLQLGSWRIAYACYAAALVSALVLLAFLYSRRLRVTRRPER